MLSKPRKAKSKRIPTRADTTQKAKEAGAEQLPVTMMLLRGYMACLAPRGTMGVDSYVFDPDGSMRIAKVQSKYTGGATSIPLDLLLFDFLVVYRDVVRKKGKNQHDYPKVYVIPVSAVKKAWDGQSINLSNFQEFLVGEVDSPVDQWDQIVQFFKKESAYE